MAPVTALRRALAALVPVLALLGAAWPAAAADPVVVAAGDAACDPANVDYNSGQGANGNCHQKYTSDLFAGLAPTKLLALGDLQYEDGALTKFQQSYDPSWGRAKSITRPVPGNHEYGSSGSNSDPKATGYFTYFASVLAPFGPNATDPKKGYYRFNLSAGSSHWHVIALNSECAAGLASSNGWLGGCAAGSAQEQWLRSDLAADTSDCTIAYWHHPLFSSGYNNASVSMRPVWDALYSDYADVVLNGHDHDYERFAPQDPNGVAAPGRGIREWVVGTGGRSLSALPDPPNSEVRNDTAYGALKLTLHGPSSSHPRGWYEWAFVREAGSASTFSDSGSADCVGPRPGTSGASPSSQGSQNSPRRHRIHARIYRVLDGEILKARATTGTRRRYTVRLLGLDAPNRRGGECGSGRSRRSLKRLGFAGRHGRRVTLITDPSQPLRDGRRRLLAYVKRRDGKNLAVYQLRRGWARVRRTRPPFELRRRFRRAQRRARAAHRGAWRLCDGAFHRSL
ncbi:MAG: metallophosphoesterase [Thermoleophilaceae bacterium]